MASAASSIPQLAPVGNLSRYLRTIRKFPMLEPDEEYVLAKRWRDNADVEAAHRLVTSHLRLVVKIASDCQCAPLACDGALVRPGTRPCIEGTVTRSQSCIEETLDLP